MKKYAIEQINVSDLEYKIIELNLEIGVFKSGDVIFSYESSKSIYEVLAEEFANFYFNPNVRIGEVYPVGTLIAISSVNVLSSEELDQIFTLKDENKGSISKPDELIITKKAKALIDKHKIDYSVFSEKSVVSEDDVLEFLNSSNSYQFQNVAFYHENKNLSIFPNHLKRLAVIGAGKAALQVFDSVFISKSHQIVSFYDENINHSNKYLLNIPIKIFSDLNQIILDFEDDLFDEIIISFSGDLQKRKQIFEFLYSKNIPFTNVIHPSVIIGTYSKIGVGNLIFANSRIGPFSILGNNNVISSYCSIEHHNLIGSHNTFGPAVCFSGTCSVGDENKFGTGIYIEPNVVIENKSIISSGISLTRNVPNSTLVRNLNKIELKKIS